MISVLSRTTCDRSANDSCARGGCCAPYRIAGTGDGYTGRSIPQRYPARCISTDEIPLHEIAIGALDTDAIAPIGRDDVARPGCGATDGVTVRGSIDDDAVRR